MAKFDTLRSGLVLDTGALFCTLIFNYIRSTGLVEQKRTQLLNNTIPSAYRWRPRFADEYLAALSKRRPLVTTAHVIAELQGLTKGRAKLHSHDFSAFWDISLMFIEGNVIEEEVSMQDLCKEQRLRKSLLEIGPTDAVMIALALRRHIAILTIDGRALAQHARAFAVVCLFPEDILS